MRSKKDLKLFVAIVAIMVVLTISARWWLPSLLRFIGTNTELVQGLSSFIQILLWIGTLSLFLWKLWTSRSTEAPHQTNLYNQKEPNQEVSNNPTIQNVYNNCTFFNDPRSSETAAVVAHTLPEITQNLPSAEAKQREKTFVQQLPPDDAQEYQEVQQVLARKANKQVITKQEQKIIQSSSEQIARDLLMQPDTRARLYSVLRNVTSNNPLLIAKFISPVLISSGIPLSLGIPLITAISILISQMGIEKIRPDNDV